MEKLLHERLRECEGFGDLCYFIDYDGEEEYEAYTKLADEIERYYIPRPRFEDGEPIQWGEEFDNGFDVSRLTNFQVGEDGDYCLNDYIEDPDLGLEKGEFVKRPTPKALDADGVEIKVGDIVYSIYGDHRFTVKSIEAHNGNMLVMETFDIGTAPDALTHEKPVFDADGVRTCKGDTVWDLKNPNRKKLTVIDVIPDDDCIVCDDKLTYTTAYITHQEPDSLEKLRDDMKLIAEHYPDSMSTPEEWVKRLTTLIERGA